MKNSLTSLVTYKRFRIFLGLCLLFIMIDLSREAPISKEVVSVEKEVTTKALPLQEVVSVEKEVAVDEYLYFEEVADVQDGVLYQKQFRITANTSGFFRLEVRKYLNSWTEWVQDTSPSTDKDRIVDYMGYHIGYANERVASFKTQWKPLLKEE